MDDFPADPASPGPRRPTLAVVIPVHNGGDDFEHCLRGLRASTAPLAELIVVDDGSADDSAAVAARHGATLIRHPLPEGPAAARNAGATAAAGDIIFFLDADVVPHPNALALALARFEADPTLAALFGSYDDAPAAPGTVSRFRNLLHHYVHQQGDFVADARPAGTFWTGCGAIRRDVFLAAGGFDPRTYRRPAIEDIELGRRVTAAGHRIVLARDVLAMHLKRWTLGGMIHTDVMCRGVPWLLLMKRERFAETDLNLNPRQKASVALAGLAVALLSAMPAWRPSAALAAGSASAVVALNLDFYRFLGRRGGPRFLLGSILLHWVYFGCCIASVLIANAAWYLALRRDHSPARAAGASLRRDAAGTSRPHAAGSATRRASRWKGR